MKSAKDDTVLVQMYIDKGLPLPLGSYVTKGPLRIPVGGWTVCKNFHMTINGNAIEVTKVS